MLANNWTPGQHLFSRNGNAFWDKNEDHSIENEDSSMILQKENEGYLIEK